MSWLNWCGVGLQVVGLLLAKAARDYAEELARAAAERVRTETRELVGSGLTWEALSLGMVAVGVVLARSCDLGRGRTVRAVPGAAPS